MRVMAPKKHRKKCGYMRERQIENGRIAKKNSEMMMRAKKERKSLRHAETEKNQF
jgi:hypothetical protein